MQAMKLDPLGDSAVVATMGHGIDESTLASVLRLAVAVAAAKRKGIIDIVPAYATLTVFYDPEQFSQNAYESVGRFVELCALRAGTGGPMRAAAPVEIPVCYGGEFGPDLGTVADHCRKGAEEVAAIHAAADYLVHAIGFVPGFPYLGGLPESLCTPRRGTPRTRVPAGSVGIGGAQTGVYPIEAPGGWQVIGRTPIALFRPDREPAALLSAGNRVRFRPITAQEFQSWK